MCLTITPSDDQKTHIIRSNYWDGFPKAFKRHPQKTNALIKHTDKHISAVSILHENTPRLHLFYFEAGIS